MCNEKVMLTPKQAKKLQSFNLSNEKNRVECILDHVDNLGKDDFWRLRVPDLSTEDLIKAIYIGYEVEKTPEEKLVDYFSRMDNDTADASALIAKGIYETLKILELKVEGIN